MIVLRYSNEDPNRRNGPWSEKVHADENRRNPAFSSLGFLPYTKKWFHLNVPQLNPKGYSYRLFLIETESKPSKQAVIDLVDYVCGLINATPGNDTTVTPANPLFWLGEFAIPGANEVFGHQESLKMIVAEAGTPVPGYFEQHRSLIRFHYREQSLTMDVARLLHAPIEQVHPDLRIDLAAPAAAAAAAAALKLPTKMRSTWTKARMKKKMVL